MNRLDSVAYFVNGIHQSAEDLIMEYDQEGLGNIVSKTDVGTTINYGEQTGGSTSPAGPNALTTIHGFTNYQPEEQTVEYTVFNKVSDIAQITESSENKTLQIVYGFDDQRRQSVFSYSGDPDSSRTKLFFGDYEQIIENNQTRAINYIYAPTGLCAIYEYYTESSPDSSGQTLWYINTDHLGSIAYARDASNPTNSKEFSYNVWGIPRDPTDWTQPASEKLLCHRGFTGHEHLPEFELIDMNGRVYDPVLGRFLSVDPYVQMPDFRDGFNRYT